MKNNRYFIALVIGIFSAFSFMQCKDVIEEDLEDEVVIMLAPSHGLTTTVSTINFWWEHLEGADAYNIQVVSPSFDSLERMVLDSNITTNQYQLSLTPGEYEWSVLGYNSVSSSGYYIYKLYVDSSESLSEQTVILTTPINADTTNETSITFGWDELYSATNYSIEIWTPNFEGQRVLQENIEGTNFSYKFESNGSFEWGISAENEISKTLFSKRTIYIDTVAPKPPTLSYPANNASLPDTAINFTWTRPSDNGSSISDLIEIFKDTTNTPIVSVSTVHTSHSDSLGAGTFFWRVTSNDAAGNIGQPSSYNTLQISNKHEK